MARHVIFVVIGSLAGAAWLALDGDTVLRAALALLTGFALARGISGVVSSLRSR